MPPGKIYLSNHGSEVVTEALFPMVWSKKRPRGFNRAMGRFHQRPVILISHVLAQTDGSNLIEFAGRFTIIPLNHFNGKPRTPSTRIGDLLRGNIIGDHRTAVLGGRILRKASPPAPEFENAFALVKLQLPTDQLQLMFLCFCETYAPASNRRRCIACAGPASSRKSCCPNRSVGAPLSWRVACSAY